MAQEAASSPTYPTPSLELFFDLAFVFAVSQLSKHLLSNLSWRGLAETVVLLVPVFAVWSYTSWAAIIGESDGVRTRPMLLSVMLLGLFMNVSLTTAFDGHHGWGLVVPFLMIQVLRSLWTISNSRQMALAQRFKWILVWILATSPLWIAGAVAGPSTRLAWWGSAAAIDELGNWLGHPVPGRRLVTEGIEFAGGRMAERCVLFTIIALGETVITTGSAMATASLSATTVATGTLALISTVALWSLVFGHTSQLIGRLLDETSDPYHAARHAVDALTLMVAGLVSFGVASATAIRNPLDTPGMLVSVLLCGGPVVYLLAHGWYLWHVPKVRPWLRLLGSVALLATGVASHFVPLYIGLLLVALVLSALVAASHRGYAL